MKLRKAAAMMSSVNEYSPLKWPITLASLLTTLLAFILLLSFRSNSWFTYEFIQIDNKSAISNTTTPTYSRILEYGTVGLWTICTGHYNDPNLKCDVWTKETRPHSFNVIIVLVSCALFLSNLTVFPSWGASILILQIIVIFVIFLALSGFCFFLHYHLQLFSWLQCYFQH
jgi:hypothetical protein